MASSGSRAVVHPGNMTGKIPYSLISLRPIQVCVRAGVFQANLKALASDQKGYSGLDVGEGVIAGTCVMAKKGLWSGNDPGNPIRIRKS